MATPTKHVITRDDDADLTVSISDSRIFIDGTFAENITDLTPEHARQLAQALDRAATVLDVM